jgi:hypothetical protein
MTRRGWTWALGLLACSALLPACTRTVPGVAGGATAMGDGNDPMAVAAGPGGSPYIQQPVGSGANASSVLTAQPAMPTNIIEPKHSDEVAAPVEHHSTLMPPLDPTPGDETPSKTPTDSQRPSPVAKQVMLASLPGLAPAVTQPIETRPDHLPPALPAKTSVTPAQIPTIVTGASDNSHAQPADKPLVQAMRCFLDKRPGEALLHLKGYDKDNQEMLLLLLPLAARMSEGKLLTGNPQDVTFYTEQLSNLLVRIRPRLSLVIDKICFCRDIRGFGMYDPLPDTPIYHRNEHVDIYMEVRNFSSKPVTSSGQVVYVTELRTSAEIFTRDRRTKVWPAANERFVFHRDGPDICRTLRHDYFDHCYFMLPRDLPSGAYTLSLQVEDVPTKRVVREALDFIVK